MRYEIWSEGYRITGNSSGAWKMGEAEGGTFEEACQAFMKGYEYADVRYDSKHNTFWACRLFPTEEQARESFG